MSSPAACGLTTMPEQHTTNAVNIFLKMVDAVRRGVTMKPRSANDKEYFARDWFADRLKEVRITFQQQGRNSYPHFPLTARLVIASPHHVTFRSEVLSPNCWRR